MKNKSVLIILAFLLVFLLLSASQAPSEVMDFESCVQKGLPVMESYPRQCKSKETTFVEDIGNALQKTDLIVLENPRPNSRVASVIMLSGNARGYWFFEANFPIDVLDANGKIVGQGYGEARGDWMTEDFVPFESTVTLKEDPQTSKGAIVLRKNNPSGDPERDDSLIVPISFK